MSSSLFADFYINYDADAKPAPEKYYIYAEDRKGSYLIPIYESLDRDEVILKLQKIISGKFHPTWAKKYTHSAYLGEAVNGVYKDYKEFQIPFVQFTITHGKYSWYNAVNLIFDLKNRKMYYDKERINLHYIKDPNGNVDIKLKKAWEWNGKLTFRKPRQKK